VDAILRLFPVLHVLAGALLLFAPAFLVPLAFSMALADGAHAAYETGFLVTFVAALFTFFLTRGRHRRELQPRDGFLLVTLVWTVVPAFATIPLLIAIPGLGFTDAYFEAVSGMTTSG
jgi:trk system potassium uptake protein TrkH